MFKNKLVMLSLAFIFLGIGSICFAEASGQELTGYIYSQDAGWVSLNCKNTDSCDTISYNVSIDNAGVLSGYGFSQNGEWINFNPDFGGVTANSVGELSGWVFTDQGDWLRIDGVKVVASDVLQKEVTSIKDTIDESDNMSTASLLNSNFMDLLNNLCNQIFSSSQCSNIN
jgi:hypothetical protein